MSQSSALRPWRACTKLAIAVLLAASACVYLGYHLAISLDSDDTNHLETPLALALSRQVEEGPAHLYGPFCAERPTVLIHAPLYYRLAGLGAWSLAALRISPVLAALAAGRLLSLLAFLAALAGAAWLARLDGAPAWAGVASALLLAASPVVGSFPVTVRPDTLALCLQTLGAALVLRTWLSRKSSTMPLVCAYVAYGLAFCVKQHDVVTALASSALLGAACVRGELRARSVVIGMAAGLVTVLAYYGAEQLAGGGLVLRSVFEVPAELRRVDPGSWRHVADVSIEVAKMSVGLLALAAAGFWAARGYLPRCRLDRALGFFLAAELAVMLVLCLNSAGAWTNYAMQAVVFAAVLMGRAIERLGRGAAALRRLVPLSLAAGLLFAADVRLVWISASARASDRMALEAIFADPHVGGSAPGEIYFVGAPQHNRRFGRIDLAHDEWLYTAFEALGAAEPREHWLRTALVAGTVRLVIAPRNRLDIPGLAEPIPALGYDLVGDFDRYLVWERHDSVVAWRAKSPRFSAGLPSTEAKGSSLQTSDDRVKRTSATPP